MRSHHVTLTRPVLCTAALALFAAPLLGAPAAAVEYDGNWQFTTSCTATGNQAAFTERFTAPITQNAATRSRSSRNAQGLEESSRFSARIENGQMTVTIDRARGNERWSLRFAGPATSDTRFDLAGGIFSGERQLRTCRLVAEAQSSAPGSLAATAPARAQAAREQLAVAVAALAALEANAAAEIQALRTDLDLARFESVAMRAELDQRGAAIQALETRLRTAEGVATQAQTALTQAVATATAEIGQRDQRLAAAEAERAALQQRLTAAEAQAQGAATERTALQGRLTAAEGALAQAQSAAAAERTALQGRLTAAEGAAAQLRTALETAQRELTEARAAQPPR